MSHTTNFRITTTITSAILRHFLIRGTVIACLGLILLWILFMTMPAESLKHVGWISCPIGLGAIVFGLLPYRKLVHKQLIPDEICAFGYALVIRQSSKKELLIPLQNIVCIQFYDTKTQYGILFRLHADRSKHTNSSKEASINLFAPFFNKNSFKKLEEYLNCQLHPKESGLIDSYP